MSPKELDAWGFRPTVPFAYRDGVTDSRITQDFANADNDAERRKFLTTSLGEGGFYKGGDEQWYVTPEGLKRAGLPHSPISVPIKPGFSDRLLSSALPTGGSMIGAASGAIAANILLPEVTIPIEVGAMIAGSGIGMGTGEALRQGVKKVRGLSDTNAWESFNKISENVDAGIQAQIVGTGLAGFGKWLLGPYANSPLKLIWGNMHQQKAVEIDAMLKKGYRPPLSYASTSKLWPIFQEYSQRIFGSPATAKNFSVALDDYRRTLIEGGVPENQVRGIVEGILRHETQEAEVAGKLGLTVTAEERAALSQFIASLRGEAAP